MRERSILQGARTWGLGIGPGGFADDLHLLATLQHHGIPTRLVDVTSNPMTALWFACQRAEGKQDATGALFAIDVTELDTYETPQVPDNTYGQLEHGLRWTLRRALAVSIDQRRPFLLRPSLPDARMQAQEGLFIAGAVPAEPSVPGVDSFPLPVVDAPGAARLAQMFKPQERTTGRPARLPFCVLLVPPSIKTHMRPHLEGTYNRSQRVLFPDLAGFLAALKGGALDLADPPPEPDLDLWMGTSGDTMKVAARFSSP